MGPRALIPAMEPPACVLRGWKVHCGAFTRISPSLPAYTTQETGPNGRGTSSESPGSRGFPALSTLGLCHRAACVVSGGTWNKGCSLGSSHNPAERHRLKVLSQNPLSTLLCSCVENGFQLPFQTQGRVLSPLPSGWWLEERKYAQSLPGHPQVGHD